VSCFISGGFDGTKVLEAAATTTSHQQPETQIARTRINIDFTGKESAFH
jgi:hypothetical protein